MDRLDPTEAFAAMQLFLEKYWLMTGSDDIALLLSSLQLLKTGRPLDPALWDDWQECVEKVKHGHPPIALDLHPAGQEGRRAG